MKNILKKYLYKFFYLNQEVVLYGLIKKQGYIFNVVEKLIREN